MLEELHVPFSALEVNAWLTVQFNNAGLSTETPTDRLQLSGLQDWCFRGLNEWMFVCWSNHFLVFFFTSQVSEREWQRGGGVGRLSHSTVTVREEAASRLGVVGCIKDNSSSFFLHSTALSPLPHTQDSTCTGKLASCPTSLSLSLSHIAKGNIDLVLVNRGYWSVCVLLIRMSWQGYIDNLKTPDQSGTCPVSEAAICGITAGQESVWASSPGIQVTVHTNTHCSSSCLYKLLNICKKKMSTSSFKASAKSFQTTSHLKTCSDWWHQPAQTATPLAHFLLLWENFLETASYFACPCLLLELWVCSVCCLSSSLPALSAVFRCCRKTRVPYRFF